MSINIEELTDQTRHFAESLCVKGIIPIPEDQEEGPLFFIQLQTHFWFPNLTDEERDYLSNLGGTVEAIRIAMSVPFTVLTPEEQKVHESNLRKMDAEYVDMKSKLLKLHLMTKLTKPQKQLIEQYYLKVV